MSLPFRTFTGRLADVRDCWKWKRNTRKHKHIPIHGCTRMRLEGRQWPGIGYTLLIWAVCYGIVRTLPFAAISEKFNDYGTGLFLGLLLTFVGVVIYAFILMYRKLQSSTFSLQSTSAPTFLMVQSTIYITQLSTWLPVSHVAENKPVLYALIMVLVVIYEWACTCWRSYIVIGWHRSIPDEVVRQPIGQSVYS